MMAAAMLAAFAAAPAQAQNRTLTLYNTHTHERLTVTYKRNGRFVPEALAQLNRFLRDWRRDEATRMDPALFDIIWDVYREVGASEPIHVVSGYRSPATNEALRARSRGVARNSQHTLGRAMDYFIPGVQTARLRVAGLRLQRGGVGFYPTANTPFVHMDTGSVRHWPRMTRQQLVRVFPNGGTVHVPTDRQPLPGYQQALVDVERRRREAGITTGGRPAAPSATTTAVATARGSAPTRDGDGAYAMLDTPSDDDEEGSGGLLSFLFGGSGAPTPPAGVGTAPEPVAVVAAAPAPAPAADPEPSGPSIVPPVPVARPVAVVVASATGAAGSIVPSASVPSATTIPAATAPGQIATPATEVARAVPLTPPNPIMPPYAQAETVVAAATPTATGPSVLPPNPAFRPADTIVLAAATPSAPIVPAPASLAPGAIPAPAQPANLAPTVQAYAPRPASPDDAQAAINSLTRRGLRPSVEASAQRRPISAAETTSSVPSSLSPIVGRQSIRASAHAVLIAPSTEQPRDVVTPPASVVASRFEAFPDPTRRADRFAGPAIRWTQTQRFTTN
ncbi:MAG: DUF882 domain-containing protein [Hyphomicrobiaceae bacterium]|nr:DUF882 domain-containing protein [Hyphomicrobiaceae bacterium]